MQTAKSLGAACRPNACWTYSCWLFVCAVMLYWNSHSVSKALEFKQREAEAMAAVESAWGGSLADETAPDALVQICRLCV